MSDSDESEEVLKIALPFAINMTRLYFYTKKRIADNTGSFGDVMYKINFATGTVCKYVGTILVTIGSLMVDEEEYNQDDWTYIEEDGISSFVIEDVSDDNPIKCIANDNPIEEENVLVMYKCNSPMQPVNNEDDLFAGLYDQDVEV